MGSFEGAGAASKRRSSLRAGAARSSVDGVAPDGGVAPASTDGGVAPASTDKGGVATPALAPGPYTTVGGVPHQGPLPTIVVASYGFRRFYEDYGTKKHWNGYHARAPTAREVYDACSEIKLEVQNATPDLILDCLGFYDPDKDSIHLGTHPKNMYNTAHDKHLPGIFGHVRHWIMGRGFKRREPLVMILCYCRSGNHRSVAVAEILY